MFKSPTPETSHSDCGLPGRWFSRTTGLAARRVRDSNGSDSVNDRVLRATDAARHFEIRRINDRRPIDVLQPTTPALQPPQSVTHQDVTRFPDPLARRPTASRRYTND